MLYDLKRRIILSNLKLCIIDLLQSEPENMDLENLIRYKNQQFGYMLL